MKTTIAFILTCLTVLAADTNDIQVVSTPNYNTQPGIVIIQEVYTRGGQTNMVCDTRTKDGALLIRTQKFYHAGVRVGDYSTNSLYDYSRSTFNSMAGVPYGLLFSFDASNNVLAMVTDTNHLVLEYYRATNGIFYPEGTAFITKLNDRLSGKLPH